MTNTQTNTKEFYFNTGVRPWINSYLAPGDKFVNNERHILFICENVPDNAIFQFASPYDNVPTYNKNVKVYKIVGGNLVSDYAYFLIND